MENEDMPSAGGNFRPGNLVRLIYILAFAFVSLAVFQTLCMGICSAIYGLSLEQISNILSSQTTDPAHKGVVYMLLVSNALGFLAPALLIPRVFRENGREYLQVNNWARPRLYLVAILLIASVQPLISLIYEWNKDLFTTGALSHLKDQVMPSENRVSGVLDVVLTQKGPLYLVINLLVIAVLPAVTEELFFRGVVQKHLYNWSGRIHLAVWTGALIFSTFHFQFLGFAPRLLLGAVLGYMVYFSGTIWVSALAHALNNSLAVIQKYMAGQENPADIWKDEYQFPDYTALVSLALSVALFFLMSRLRTRPEEIPSDE